MNFEEIVTTLLLTAFAYIGLPLIVTSIFVKISYRRPLKTIVVICTLLVFIGFSLLHFYLETGTTANAAAAGIWAFIAYWLIAKKYKNKGDKNNSVQPINESSKSSEQLKQYNQEQKHNKQEVKKPKMVYCRHCGGLIDSQTKICNKCGKQYFQIKVTLKTIIAGLVLLCAAIIALSIYEHLSYQKICEGYEKDIKSYKKTVLNLNNEKRAMSNSLDSYKLRVQSQYREIQNLKYELSFWNEHACIVTKTDDKYHKYGCPYHLISNEIWIYNIEAAKSKGYESCYICY